MQFSYKHCWEKLQFQIKRSTLQSETWRSVVDYETSLAGVTAAEAKTAFQMTVIPPRWGPYGVIGNSNKHRGKHSFTACDRSLEKKESARGRSSLNLHRKYKQNQSSEATLPWVRLWWEHTDACRFKFTHARVCARVLEIVAAPIGTMGALQWGGDHRSLWKCEHKRAASTGLWKGHKGRTSLWHGALSPSWPSDTDTAASKPLATEPEQRAQTRMADHKRLPGLRAEEQSFLGNGQGQVLWHEWV